jgi:hypothetical protein
MDFTTTPAIAVETTESTAGQHSRVESLSTHKNDENRTKHWRSRRYWSRMPHAKDAPTAKLEKGPARLNSGAAKQTTEPFLWEEQGSIRPNAHRRRPQRPTSNCGVLAPMAICTQRVNRKLQSQLNS